jgi:hypothetical protein
MFQWMCFVFSVRLFLFSESDSLPYEQLLQRIRFVFPAGFVLSWIPYPVTKYSSVCVRFSQLASLCVAQLESSPCEKVCRRIPFVFSTSFVSLSPGFMALRASIPGDSFCCLNLFSFVFPPEIPYPVSTDSSGFVLFSHLASF